MNLSSDQIVFWEYGFIRLNLTLVMTWSIMLLLTLASCVVTRRLSMSIKRSRWQNLLEMIILYIRRQIGEIGLAKPDRYLPFIGTLFIFIAMSTLLTIVPGYMPPTGSLSTTSALAICVFFAVPAFGIREQGVRGYFGAYLRPTVLMLPFNLIGEFSRTLAMAVRLFGNMMSGVMIVAILLSIAPLVVPVLMTLFGLVTGLVQAYIFSVLTAVYISAATKSHEGGKKDQKRQQKTAITPDPGSET